MATVDTNTEGQQPRLSNAFSDEGIDEFDLRRLQAASQKETEGELDSDAEASKNVQEDDFSMLRMIYQLPLDNDELSFKMGIFMSYLKEHKIDAVLTDVIKDLLSQDQLPYNPHAGFHRALKVQNQNFDLDKIPQDTVVKALNMPTYLTDISYLAGIRKFANVWGLASVIKTMSPRHLKEFEWLLNSVTPDKTTLVYHKGFTAQTVLSLVGHASFYGSFYPEIPSISFRVHYVIMGNENRDLALNVFAESVLNDVFYAMNQNDHLFLGLFIENDNCGGYKSFETDRYFTPEFILREEQWILDELVNAARGAQKVSAEMMFLVDPHLKTYKRGQKQYECYFIDISTDNQDDLEEIFSFAEFFMASMYEGCFLRKHEAEAYLGIFCSRQLLVNYDRPSKDMQAHLRSDFVPNKRLPFKPNLDFERQELNSSEGRARKPRAEIDEPIDRTEQLRINQELEADLGIKSSVLQSKNEGNKVDPRRAIPSNTSNSRFLSNYVEMGRPPSPVWNHGIAYPENRKKPVINGTKGVRVTSEDQDEDIRPDSRGIKAPLRTHFERNICQLDNRNNQFFEQLHKLILLNLMDKYTSSSEILSAIYRVLHGFGWKIMCNMMQNVALQEIVFSFHKSRVSVDLLNLEFQRYRENLNILLGSELQEKSSDHESLLLKCNYYLDQIRAKEDPPMPLTDVVPLNISTIDTLRRINSMVEAQLIWSMENIQNDKFPLIMDTIARLRENYPTDFVIPTTPRIRRERGERFQPKTKWKPPNQEKADVFNHGVEFKFIIEQDDLFVVPQNALGKHSAPESIKLDVIFMQYLIDTRVDEVWKEYIIELGCAPSLPPNPWPRLITAFREAALKMELFFEYEQDLLKRVVDINAGKLIDRENFIYNLPSTKIFSHKMILPIISLPHAQKLIDYAQMFDNKQFPQSIGQFKIASTLALVGHTFLYGKVTPYLGVLELDEHVFFKGPSGCWFEALQHYCGLIWNHIQDLDTAYRTVTGTFMGFSEKRMSLVDTLERPKAFKAELEFFLRRKEPVYIKTYVVEDWRYIPVVKYLKFHYLNENETDTEVFYKEDWAHLHTNLFWLKNKAAFHFQQSGPPLQQDPCNRVNLRKSINDINKRIKKCRDQVDYLSAYRWLCTRSLLDESYDHVASCWRMSNSTVGMLEYCNVLNKSLQELILYAMESRYSEEKSPLKSVSLGMMANAYRYKINKSLERVGSLAPSNLDELTQEKLRDCMEWDEISHNAFLKIEDRSLEILREISDLTEGIIVAVAHDINSICEKSQSALKNLKLRKNPYSVMDEVNGNFAGGEVKNVDEWRRLNAHQKGASVLAPPAERITMNNGTSSRRSNRPSYINNPYVQMKDPFPNL